MSARRNCLVRCCLCLVAIGVIEPALGHPGSGIVVDAQGQVYFMDTGHGLWQVDAAGRLTSRGGPAFHFVALDEQGKFLARHFSQLAPGDIVLDKEDPRLVLASSYPVAIGSDGALYYPDVVSKGRVRIMRMVAGEPGKPFATLPVAHEGDPDGKQIEAEWIWGLAAGPNGSLYYTEKKSVRRIAPDGTVSLLAGEIVVPDCEHPPAITDERLEPSLYGLDVAADGTVYVAAAACSALLKISPAGEISVALRATDGWSPQGVAFAGGDVYVLEYYYVQAERREDWLPRVRKLSADGTVSLVAEVKSRPKTGRAYRPPNDALGKRLDAILPPPKMHSAVVHFPIVLSFVCIAAAALSLVLGKSFAWRVQAVVLFLALAAACVSGERTGDRAELEIPYGENGVAPVVWEHMREHTTSAGRLKTIAYAGVLISLVTLIPRKNSLLAWSGRVAGGLLVCLAIGASVVAVRTAHWGGDLVYGHGIGTEPLVRSLTEKSASRGETSTKVARSQTASE